MTPNPRACQHRWQLFGKHLMAIQQKEFSAHIANDPEPKIKHRIWVWTPILISKKWKQSPEMWACLIHPKMVQRIWGEVPGALLFKRTKARRESSNPQNGSLAGKTRQAVPVEVEEDEAVQLPDGLWDLGQQVAARREVGQRCQPTDGLGQPRQTARANQAVDHRWNGLNIVWQMPEWRERYGKAGTQHLMFKAPQWIFLKKISG